MALLVIGSVMLSKFLLNRAEIHQKGLYAPTPQFSRRLPSMWLKDIQVRERQRATAISSTCWRETHPRNQGYNLNKYLSPAQGFRLSHRYPTYTLRAVTSTFWDEYRLNQSYLPLAIRLQSYHEFFGEKEPERNKIHGTGYSFKLTVHNLFDVFKKSSLNPSENC